MNIKVLFNAEDDETAGLAINADGVVAGFAISGTSSSNNNPGLPRPAHFDTMGMRWRVRPLPFVTGSSFIHTKLVAINKQGWAVGTRHAPGKLGPVLCKEDELIPLAGLDQTAQITGINDLGQVCGYLPATPLSPPRDGFVLDLASHVATPIPIVAAGSVNQACAINNLSEVACVAWDSENSPAGFIYRGQQKLLALHGESISIYGLSDKTVAVGSVSYNGINPAIWSSPATTPEPQVLTSYTFKGGEDGASTFGPGGQAMGVNADGAVVGFFYGQNYDPVESPQDALAFLYSEGNMFILNDFVRGSGWNLTNATGISNATIVDRKENKWLITGSGLFNGQFRGFVLPFPPDPEASDFNVTQAISQLFFGGSPHGASSGIWQAMDRGKQDALISFAIDELAKSLADPAARRALRETSLRAARAQIEGLLRENNHQHNSSPRSPNNSTRASAAYREALNSFLSRGAK